MTCCDISLHTYVVASLLAMLLQIGEVLACVLITEV